MARMICGIGSKEKMEYIEREMSGEGGAIPFSSSSFLKSGETILYETQRHWSVILPYLAVALGCARSSASLSLLILIIPFFQLKTYRYTVTDKRILICRGLFRRETAAIRLQDIVRFHAEKTALGFKVGMGTVYIEDRNKAWRLSNISDPDAFLFYLRKTHEKST